MKRLTPTQVSFIFVPGHAGHMGNEGADGSAGIFPAEVGRALDPCEMLAPSEKPGERQMYASDCGSSGSTRIRERQMKIRLARKD